MLQAAIGYIVGQLVTAAFFVWWMSRPASWGEQAQESLPPPLPFQPRSCLKCQRVGEGVCRCEQECEAP